jgi:hypothetical protein
MSIEFSVLGWIRFFRELDGGAFTEVLVQAWLHSCQEAKLLFRSSKAPGLVATSGVHKDQQWLSLGQILEIDYVLLAMLKLLNVIKLHLLCGMGDHTLSGR